MSDKAEDQRFPLHQIYFYLTDGCNLRCRHCWVAPKYRSEGISPSALDLYLFREIVKQAKPMGLTSVKLTGGEPLLHQEIEEILDFVRAEDLYLAVETNGLMCTPELAHKVAACKDPFVSVSLDGAEAETHEWVRGVRDCFDSALEGIANLVNARINPQIIMTIMRCNRDQLEPLVRLVEILGGESVKFNILQPTARGERMHGSGEALSIEELVDLGRWVEGDLSASTSLRILYSHPMAFKPLGKMFGDSGDDCGTCGILGILGVLANGSYALCGIGETVPELVFGHAASDPLQNIWNDTPVLKELREGIPQRFEGVCRDCLMKGICVGGCLAQNYYRSKRIWAAYWYCQEAYDKGLFPATRMVKKMAKVA